MSVSRVSGITSCSMPRSSTKNVSRNWDALQKQQLRTGRAWSIKDYFRWFWDEPDAIAGREFFDHWYNWAIRSRLEPMREVAKMLKNDSTTFCHGSAIASPTQTPKASTAASKRSSPTPAASNPSRTTELASSSSAEKLASNQT